MEGKTWVRNWGNLSPKLGRKLCPILIPDLGGKKPVNTAKQTWWHILRELLVPPYHQLPVAQLNRIRLGTRVRLKRSTLGRIQNVRMHGAANIKIANAYTFCKKFLNNTSFPNMFSTFLAQFREKMRPCTIKFSNNFLLVCFNTFCNFCSHAN